MVHTTSGDPTTSLGDIKVTRDLVNGGSLLEIDVLDHIVIGRRFISMKRQRLGFR